MLGLRYRFQRDLDLQVDLYQKLYKDLRPRYENLLDIYEFAPESNFDRARIDPSSGEAYGVEVTLRNRNVGALDWWVNYTWSKVRRYDRRRFGSAQLGSTQRIDGERRLAR